jgi:hypothetical protein
MHGMCSVPTRQSDNVGGHWLRHAGRAGRHADHDLDSDPVLQQGVPASARVAARTQGTQKKPPERPHESPMATHATAPGAGSRLSSFVAQDSREQASGTATSIEECQAAGAA